MPDLDDKTIAQMAALLVSGEDEAERAALSLRSVSVAGAPARDAAVPTLLSHLHRGNPRRVLLLQTLSNLCRRVEQEPAVSLEVVAPALPLVKNIFNHKDHKVLEAACTVVANITHGPNERTGAVQAVPGLLDCLVGMLEHEDAIVRRPALLAVSNMLAGTSAQVDECLDAGCLDSIFSFLRSSDLFLVEHAARATANIFVHTHATQKALETGILTPLRKVFENGNDKCAKQALKAIGNLCYYGTAAQRDSLVSSGALEPYCAVLAPPDYTLAPLVLCGLSVLVMAAERDRTDSDYDENSDFNSKTSQPNSDGESDHNLTPLFSELNKNNLHELLQQLLQKEDIAEDLRRKALELSVSIRFHIQSENIVYEAGKLFTAPDIAEELKSSELVRQVQGARAARCLLSRARKVGVPRLRGASKTLEEAGALQPLVVALNNDCFDLQLEAIRAFSILTCEKSQINFILENKTSALAVALLSKKSQISVYAAVTIGNIASNGVTSRNEILQQGAVESMLPFMRPDTPPRRLRAYVAAYEKMCRLYTVAVKFEQVSSALPLLSELLCVEDQRVLVHACGILVGMTYGEAYRTRIATVQAIPDLTARVTALLEHKSVQVRKEALRVIANMLCGNEPEVASCLNAGFLDHMIAFLQCSEPLLVHKAAQTAGIFFGHGSHEQIKLALDRDILNLLRNLLTDGDAKCQDNATWAIIKLYKNGSVEQRDQLVSSGVFQVCCGLLASPHSNTLRTLITGLEELLENKDRHYSAVLLSLLKSYGVEDQLKKIKSKSDASLVFLNARSLLRHFDT